MKKVPFAAILSLCVVDTVLAIEFGTIQQNSALSEISTITECLGGGFGCTASWTVLNHAALDGRWRIFVSPLSVTNNNDFMSTTAQAVDLRTIYNEERQQWVIAKSFYPTLGTDRPGLHLNVYGEFGVAAVSSDDPSLIALNIPHVYDTSASPVVPIDHPLLNDHPDAILALSYAGPSEIAGDYFCGYVRYDAEAGRWGVGSYCPAHSTLYYWGGAQIAIKVAQPGTQGVRHVVTDASRQSACRAMAQCSRIDHPLLNGRPDLVLIGTRGPGNTAAPINFRYSDATGHWQIECVPANAEGVRTAPTQPCTLLNGGEYHIWAPKAGESARTTTIATPEETAQLFIPPYSARDTDVMISQMIASPLGSGGNGAQSAFLSFTGQWRLYLLRSATSFSPTTAYGIHSFPPAQNAYLHQVTARNRLTNSRSVIDHPLLNGRDPYFVVQSVANPFGLPDNLGPIGKNIGIELWNNQWTIVTEDGSTLPIGGYYYVYAAGRNQSAGEPFATGPLAFRHVTTMANRNGWCTALDHPMSNGMPGARVFFTHVLRDASDSAAFPIDTSFYAHYDNLFSNRWQICRDDLQAFPVNAKFNVIIFQNEESNGLVFKDGFENAVP